MTPKVLLLTTNMAPGGAETQVAQLAAGLHRRQWNVSVVSLLPVTAFEEGLTAAGVRVDSLRMRPGSPNLFALIRLVHLLRGERPQILHGHMFHANLLARAIRLICPVPVVLSTAHTLIESGSQSDDPRRREWLYHITDALADATVSVCRSTAERYAAQKVVRPAKLHVIPNSVDTRRFRPDEQKRDQMRRELGIGDEFVWLAVGRLMWKKDHGTLLRAFAENVPGLLLIAGAGPDEAKLRALSGELGVNVRFLGHREDVADLMRAADAFVLSSVVEGMPTVLLEALSSGLPCVATEVGGVGEIVRLERDGYLVPPGDPGALGAAMARLAAQPAEVRRDMGRGARERVIGEFDREVVVGQWEQLYRGLLEVSFS